MQVDVHFSDMKWMCNREQAVLVLNKAEETEAEQRSSNFSQEQTENSRKISSSGGVQQGAREEAKTQKDGA